MCIHNIFSNNYNNIHNNNNKNDESIDSFNIHQIGTNLADLSVCWHKMSLSDQCGKCGLPFYKGYLIKVHTKIGPKI